MNTNTNTRLTTDSWEEVIRHAEDGTFEETYGRSGCKEILLSYPSGAKEIIRAEIADLRHDDLADGSGKAAVTFVFKDIPACSHAMNETSKEFEGYRSWNAGGWSMSDLREDVNTRILEAMPPELKASIVAVTKISDTGARSRKLINTEDKLFVLSPEELNMADDLPETAYLKGQGYTYPIFTDAESRKRWRAGDPDRRGDWYYMRSSYLYDDYYFWIVDSSGGSDYNDANYSGGVVLGFCIGH